MSQRELEVSKPPHDSALFGFVISTTFPNKPYLPPYTHPLPTYGIYSIDNMRPTLKRQRDSASTDSEPQSASPTDAPLDTVALPGPTAADSDPSQLRHDLTSPIWHRKEPFKRFSAFPSSESLSARSVRPVWINRAPSAAWKSLVNGIQPFSLRSEQLQNIVDTFRRGEGSLVEHIARLGVWHPVGVDGSDNVHCCARTGDLQFWFTFGPGSLFELSATITENNEIANDLKSLRETVKERFTYHLKPGDSTRLTLMSRGSGHWTYEAWENGRLAVKGGNTDEDILYKCNANFETSGTNIYEPSSLDAFSQEPSLSWIHFPPHVAPGSQRP